MPVGSNVKDGLKGCLGSCLLVSALLVMLVVLDLAETFLELTSDLQVYYYEQDQKSICIKCLTSQMFLNFSIKPSFSVFTWLSFTLNLCHSVSVEKDTTTTAARGMEYTQTHTQYGQHTQAAATHIPWLGLMNGPSLNYFVQISFRPLKKRSSLFIHFTFAPGLQYLCLCLQRIYPPPIQEEEKKAFKEKTERDRETGREREKSNLHNVHKMMRSEFDNLHKL